MSAEEFDVQSVVGFWREEAEAELPTAMHAGVREPANGRDQRGVGMGEIPAAIAQSVKRFLDAVRRVRRVEAAYLYGSQAFGGANEWSDIDVAVISPDFQGDLFQERVMLLRLAVEVEANRANRKLETGRSAGG